MQWVPAGKTLVEKDQARAISRINATHTIIGHTKRKSQCHQKINFVISSQFEKEFSASCCCASSWQKVVCDNNTIS